jgi:hypothetical protein
MEEQEESFATPEKERAFRARQNSTTWYAACETYHPYWAGPDRATEDEATADGHAHDVRKHGGEETAIIFSS